MHHGQKLGPPADTRIQHALQCWSTTWLLTNQLWFDIPSYSIVFAESCIPALVSGKIRGIPILNCASHKNFCHLEAPDVPLESLLADAPKTVLQFSCIRPWHFSWKFSEEVFYSASFCRFDMLLHYFLELLKPIMIIMVGTLSQSLLRRTFLQSVEFAHRSEFRSSCLGLGSIF